MGVRRQALFAVPSIIVVLGSAFGLLGYFLGSALGIPNHLHMPFALRAAGAAVLGFGFAMMVWISRYRKPMEIITSTYVTIRKNIQRMPPEEKTSRTEPLVLRGPQRHVRHPMYFAVVAIFLGWWLALDYTFILFMTVFFFLWFNLVVIRFEERELKALYPEEYEAYAKAVPRFFPSLRSRWP